MITPKLEELILCGKAVFKTFNVGFSSKTVLDIPNGHSIVVTSITYYGRVPGNYNPDTYARTTALTQLIIGTNRKNDVIVFRNIVTASTNALNQNVITPGGSTTINTYLFYDESVYFSFTDGQEVTLFAPSVTPADATGYKFPLEYGKVGFPNSVAVSQFGSVPLPNPPNSTKLVFGGQKIPDPTGTRIRYNGVRFPPINNTLSNSMDSAPLATICYVDLKGLLPTPIAGN